MRQQRISVYEKVQICGSISELNCTSFNQNATVRLLFSLCQFVVMAQIKLKWKVKNREEKTQMVCKMENY